MTKGSAKTKQLALLAPGGKRREKTRPGWAAQRPFVRSGARPEFADRKLQGASDVRSVWRAKCRFGVYARRVFETSASLGA